MSGLHESANATPAPDELVHDLVAPADTERVAVKDAARSPGGLPRRLRLRRPALRARLDRAFRGITAIGVKELRGRMRGRRAFVILTVYLLLLAGFAWMTALILERELGGEMGSAGFASARIGQGIFGALLMLQTLLVVALAPAFTAAAISSEREKQTLDMLATTPISPLAIVLGKLLSALTYLFILVFASVPLTAIVFVFGGVAPDDVVRGYAVLLTTALGLGAVGLFFSALLKRTQAATIATYFSVLAVTLGSYFIFVFWSAMLPATQFGGGVPTDDWSSERPQRPPEALVYLNPYFAQADILCAVENGSGEWCRTIAFVTGRSFFGVIDLPPPSRGPMPPDQPEAMPGKGGDAGADEMIVAAGEPVGFAPVRDTFWPRSALSWLATGAVLILASIRLVSPTHRWRPRLPGVTRLLRRRTG
jgi:ABC-type transport system involved in multi-copper enzyme maturation permease subunit